MKYLFSIIAILMSLTSYSSYRDHLDFSFVSMGTVWKVRIGSQKKSFDTKQVKYQLIETANRYDETFSSWSSKSELRSIERMGVDTLICPSSLFLKGLRLAQQAYELSNKKFDITLGGENKGLSLMGSPMESLRLKSQAKCFYFGRKVDSLTFAGLVKGMCLGKMATWLYEVGFKSFVINAGNGNIVIAGDEKKSSLASLELDTASRVIYFVSNSYTIQSHTKNSFQHIKDPTNPLAPLLSQTQLVCAADISSRKTWYEIGAISDALSTALSVDPNIVLPTYCARY